MTQEDRLLSLLAGAALALTAACSAGGGDTSPPAGSGGSPALGTGGGTPSGGVPASAGGGAPIGTGGAVFGGGFNTMVMGRDQCAKQAYQSQLLPTNILFLVDRSGSMVCNLPPITDSVTCEANPVTADPSKPTKWSVIGGTMASAIDQLAAVPNVSVGLTFFSNDDVCGAQSAPNVEISPLLPPQVAALKNALTNANPRGGTPLVGSIILGYKHLHEEVQAPGNRFVVLMTDGSDDCLTKYAAQGVTGDVVARLLGTEIPKAISVNIRTFVIGAPGSEPDRGLLSKIAFSGGTARTPSCDHASDNPPAGAACHFDMTQTSDFAKDLSTALQSIAGSSALTCDFEVPKGSAGAGDGGALDFNSVNVDYYKAGSMADADHVPLSRDDTKPCNGGANGWQYTDSQTKIRLCGPVCDQVRADTKAQVIVSVGCQQRVVM